jgi:hypothetical protein
MRILERGTLDPESLEKLLLEVLQPPAVSEPAPAVSEPAPVVCIDCYRDGGCREHSQLEEEGR